jgi:hypothetical protein
MQPTFLPWAGYFGLIDSVDLFVFLDSVQFARRSWQQRNRIRASQGELMLTVSTRSKGLRDQRIDEVLIDASAHSTQKHLKSIRQSYAASPHRDSVIDAIGTWLESPPDSLCELNIGLITALAGRMGITTPTLRASQLEGSGAKADLLVAICRDVHATEYVSPPGSRDYLDDSTAFADAGIAVRYFEFRSPTYRQLGQGFLPQLSMIDMLFNVGFEEALSLIRDARVAHPGSGAPA